MVCKSTVRVGTVRRRSGVAAHESLSLALQGCLSYNIKFIGTLLSFILFFIVMFGGFGLELFMGKFRGRCVYGTSPI